MAIRSARGVAVDEILTTDICVIGSGAAGITLARCLDGSNTRVIMLEAGGLKRDLEAEADSFHIEQVGDWVSNPIEERGRWLGGSTNLWFGRIALPDAIDFAERPWVPKSGWPIELSELDKWYPKAASILEVPHFDSFDLSTWPMNETISAFAGGHVELQPFLWSGAQDMGKVAKPLLERSRNVMTLTDAAAQELIVDESSRVDGVRVVGPGGRTFVVRASQFVLAAGGIENPRLLLASNERFEAGIGNQHGNVGRYYLDHPRGEGHGRIDLRGLTQKQRDAIAFLDERVDGPFGTTQLRLVFPEVMQRSEELLNHSLHGYLVCDEQTSAGFGSYKRLRGHLGGSGLNNGQDLLRDLVEMGRHAPELARLATGRATPTKFVVVDQMEHEPDRESRMTVDHRNLDRFGLPRVSLDWRIGESTRRSQHRMHELFRDAIEDIGITSFSSDVLDSSDEVELIDMKHPSGMTRMSVSAADGVVDPDCRVHGIDNLFVAGSSTFPTSGHFNPTLLIVALAVRLARHLSELQRTSGRSTLQQQEQSLPASPH